MQASKEAGYPPRGGVSFLPQLAAPETEPESLDTGGIQRVQVLKKKVSESSQQVQACEKTVSGSIKQIQARKTTVHSSIRRVRVQKKTVRGIKLAGSYTVEAAFLFPIIILVLAFVLRLSIGLYVTVREAAEDTESVTELDTRGMFLDSNQIQNFLENLTD